MKNIVRSTNLVYRSNNNIWSLWLLKRNSIVRLGNDTVYHGLLVVYIISSMPLKTTHFWHNLHTIFFSYTYNALWTKYIGIYNLITTTHSKNLENLSLTITTTNFNNKQQFFLIDCFFLVIFLYRIKNKCRRYFPCCL